MESYAVIEQRHQEELQQLQETAKTLLKGLKKSAKAQVEAQIIQMEYDLKAKHREEMDALEESLGGEVLENLATVSLTAPAPVPTVSTEKSEEEIAKAKKEKAKKKQDKKASKEREREEVKQQIHSQVGGQSQRETELQALRAQLAKDNFSIKDIPSDGNCLYRAIADQLFLTNHHHSYEPTPDFKELRLVAAKHIRKHASEFAPFLGLLPDEPDFHTYCDKVASDTLAEWGGQLEIRALGECLQREIHIYSASAPLLKMGDNSNGLPPLRLAFHRHYYALGEHYNSITRIDTCCS